MIATHPATLGQQQRLGARALLQLHAGAGGFGDPVHPATTQVTGHLLGVARHEDTALGDAHVLHARDHVVQQRFELFVMGLGVVTDTAKDQHMVVIGP